jgi:hypothetical protein
MSWRSVLGGLVSAAGIVCGGAMAQACGPVLTLTYVEASPDVFEIKLAPDADGVLTDVSVDLSSSVGGAYVDYFYGPVTRNDPTVATLGAVDGFGSGSNGGKLRFASFRPGQRFMLRVDLDERVSSGNPNWLEGGEIAGTAVSATLQAPDGSRLPMTGKFEPDGTATLGARACF